MQHFTACSALQCNIDVVYYCAVLSKVHFRILNCTYIICVVRVKLQKTAKIAQNSRQLAVCSAVKSSGHLLSPPDPRLLTWVCLNSLSLT